MAALFALPSCQTIEDIGLRLDIDNAPICLSTEQRASIGFAVSPPTAVFEASLEKAVSGQTDAQDGAEPQNCTLAGVEQVIDGTTNTVVPGHYRAIIEDTGRSAGYNEKVSLVLKTGNAKGKEIRTVSPAIEIVGRNYDNLPQTGLPVVIVNTANSEPVKSKDNWKEGASMTIINPDMTYGYRGTLSIKGRGNTTWDYPKKPYALKLDTKSEILGMPKHKRWCLLANWMDRTMIRNAVAFETARRSPALEWTPRGEFVELVLNGTHLGNYYLCEQIKIDKNRVDIEELDNTVTEGDGITGGFVMELDTYYDEPKKFRSAIRNLPWMFKDPDDVNYAQLAYMRNYVCTMETALYDNSRFATREFADYMDLESFVDWWFVHELTSNREPNHPKSSYMHKDRNGVIKAGPVWDFDWGTFLPANASSFTVSNAIYYGRLFEDEGFRTLARTKWQAQKTEYEKIGLYIDDLGRRLCESDRLNNPMWPISSTVNGDESMDFQTAVATLKSAYLAKLNWMDSQILSW